MLKRKLAILLIALPGLILNSGQVFGYSSCAPEPDEFINLPDWCPHIWGPGRNPSDSWGKKTFGHLWQHMHHYCFALNCINRAQKARAGQVPRVRGQFDRSKSLLGTAISNLQYVANHLNGDEPFAPELYLKMGKIYQQMKDYPDAASAYTRAVLYNPRYEPAYLAHAELLHDLGDDKAAAGVLDAALKYLPDSKTLQAALQKVSQPPQH